MSGTRRVATRIGEVPAVILELPAMLALSWWACGRVVTRCLPRCPSASRSGAAAFALLGAELGVSMWRFGRTLAEHLAACGSPPAALGLAGQVAFAAFPLLRLARPRAETDQPLAGLEVVGRDCHDLR